MPMVSTCGANSHGRGVVPPRHGPRSPRSFPPALPVPLPVLARFPVNAWRLGLRNIVLQCFYRRKKKKNPSCSASRGPNSEMRLMLRGFPGMGAAAFTWHGPLRSAPPLSLVPHSRPGSSWSLCLITFTRILGSGLLLGKHSPSHKPPLTPCINVHAFITIPRHRAFHGAHGGALDTPSPYILEGEAQNHQAQK